MINNAIEFIKEIAKEMKLQSNRATQDVGFVVYNLVGRPSNPDIGYDEKLREENGTSSYDDLCDECKKKYDNDEDLPDDCDECDDCCFWYSKLEYEEDVRAGVFLTEKACWDHINKNMHHYNNPKVYGISFWRNEEIKKLINAIFILSGEEQPNHYTKINLITKED